jgi:hypothetical protein
MNGAGLRREQPPEACGTQVTEDGSLTAGENGGHPAALHGQKRISNRINALVDAVETTPPGSL